MRKLDKFWKKLKQIEPNNTISRIHKEAKNSLCLTIGGDKMSRESLWLFNTLWYIMPILIPLIGIFSHSDDIAKSIDRLNGFIGVAIPLFVGVFFSLFLAIPSSTKRFANGIIDDSTKINIMRGYKQIASIILRLILTCIYIVLLFLLSITILPQNLYIQLLYYFFVVFLSARFIVSIIYLIVRYYYLYRIELWH